MPTLFGIITNNKYKKERTLIEKISMNLRHTENQLTQIFDIENGYLGWSGPKSYHGFQGPDINKRPWGIVMVDGYFTNSIKGFSRFSEYVAHIWEEGDAKEGLVKIKGVFQLLIWDSREEKLFLMNDRYGMRTLFYQLTKDSFIFSSEFSPFLSLYNINKDIDWHAVYDVISFGYVLGKKSFLKNVKLQRYATILDVDKGLNLEEHQYWHYPAGTQYLHMEPNEAVEEAVSIIKTTFPTNLPSNGRPGVTLSAGLDSRLFAGLCNQEGLKPVCYHWGNMSSKVTRISKHISETLGSQFFVYPREESDINTFKEGIVLSGEPLVIEQYILLPLARFISEQGLVDYIIDGYGIDMLFYHAPFLVEHAGDWKELDTKVEAILRCFRKIPPQGWMQKIVNKDILKNVNIFSQESVAEWFTGLPEMDLTETLLAFYFDGRGRRRVSATPRLTDLFVHVIMPGIHYDLFDFATKLHPSLRISFETIYNKIVANAVPDIGNITYESTMRPPLEGLSKRYKAAEWIKNKFYYLSRLTNGRLDFLPPWELDHRFRYDKDFRKQVIGVFKKNRLLEFGIVKPDGIQQLYDLQDSGRNLFLSIFSPLIMLEIFLDTWGN